MALSGASELRSIVDERIELTRALPEQPKRALTAAVMVGLYLVPPERAIVLSVDEKTQIQALDRTQPMLPLRSGSVERRTHDYERHGTTSLFAALNVATGEVTHEARARHTAVDFLAFLRRLDRVYPEQELHVVLDNVSSHKTPAVRAWLERHRRITFHFTPTSASWLNQIETCATCLPERPLGSQRPRHRVVALDPRRRASGAASERSA